MAPITIVQAIKHVMLRCGKPLTIAEAYGEIVKENLYEFHSENPISMVRSQIRRYCEGLDFPSSSPTKHFKIVGDSRYFPLEKMIKFQKNITKKSYGNSESKHRSADESTISELMSVHEHYIKAIKHKILTSLTELSPQTFELFAKRLIDTYGFHDTKVTQVSGDGGIDGFGKLKVGLASLNVAFQCKKWTKGKIQRPEIDKFRGAAQGDFEQGIFFTTSSFSKGAIEISIKRGAVPIVLIDGEAIVDLMISKGFGVQIETLSIPTYALDIALANDEPSS